MRDERLRRLIRIGMLGGMAFLLQWLIQIPLPFLPPYLAYDPGDIPAMIATFGLGPGAGVGVQTIKSLLFWTSGKSTAGFIGVLANFLAGVALVIAAGLMQKVLERSGPRHWGWGLLSAAVGTLFMTAVLIPVNGGLIYPLYGMKGAAAWTGALTLSTPLNLFKGFVSSALSLAFYRRLQPFLLGKPVHKIA